MNPSEKAQKIRDKYFPGKGKKAKDALQFSRLLPRYVATLECKLYDAEKSLTDLTNIVLNDVITVKMND